MAEMWYYTTEGKQMDPVTMRELKKLVGEGVLKPTDMVWKDGMARWIRASSVKELFPDPTSGLDQFFQHAKDKKVNVITAPIGATPQSSTAVEPESPNVAPIPAPADSDTTQKRRRTSNEDDDRPAPRRRPEPARNGSGMGVIIALVIGAMLILGALGVGVVILIMLSQSPGDGKINPVNLIKGEVNYKLLLNNNTQDTRRFSFRKGVDYEIIIKTVPQQVDVDVYVFHQNGNVEAFDDGPAADCYVRFTPRADGEYRVEVRNLEHDGPANSTVTIREVSKEQKGGFDKKDAKDKDQPLPPDVLEGSGLKPINSIPLKKEETHKFRVRAGHKATFKFVPTKTGPGSDFNIIVVKDNDLNQEIAKDIGPEATASVSFTLPATEIVRVRVINNSTKGGPTLSRGFLEYNVSP
jgi:GYF domain 2